MIPQLDMMHKLIDKKLKKQRTPKKKHEGLHQVECNIWPDRFTVPASESVIDLYM